MHFVCEVVPYTTAFNGFTAVVSSADIIRFGLVFVCLFVCLFQ